MQLLDLTNQRFGRLVAKEYLGTSRWKLQCDCGNVHTSQATHLRSGMTLSCGCLGRERRAAALGIISERALTNIVARFMSHVQKTDTCWLWMAKRGFGNYGRFRGPAPLHKWIAAHRASYEFFVGPIDDDMLICHTCDNPLCVNPKHLFQGTNQDNALDCIAKGRHRWQIYPDGRKPLTAEVFGKEPAADDPEMDGLN